MNSNDLRRYRRLRYLFPRRFRRRYGTEQERLFIDELTAARRRGGWLWYARFWLHTLADNVIAAFRLWLHRPRSPRAPSGDSMIATVTSDFVQAFRSVHRNWRFFLGALAVLSLGIGATTVAFSVLDGVLIRPLPYPAPDRLVQVGSTFRHDPAALGPVSDADFVALRRDATAFEVMAAIGGRTVVLTGRGDAEHVSMARVTDGYQRLLGGRSVAGRLLVPGDHETGAPRAVVLAHRFWVDRFGGETGAIGTTLRLDGEAYEIVGVMAPGFSPPARLAGADADMWTPLPLGPEADGRMFYLSVLGRLGDGVSDEQAVTEVQHIIEERYARGDGPNFVIGGTLAPLRDRVLGEVARPIALAQAGVSLLLLITCVNVASLLLARAADRRREVAVRAALGARPARLLSQLVAESVLLGVTGGAVGAGLAVFGVQAFKAVSPGNLPRLSEISVDGRILLFALAVSVATGVLFGLLPAWQAARVGPSEVLREGGRLGTEGSGRGRLRGGLVVGEVALAVILALGAGLLANSYVRLTRVDPGFRPEGLLAMRLDLRYGYDERERWTPFFGELLTRARVLPGVDRATLTSQVPFTEDGIVSSYRLDDRPADGEDDDRIWIPTVLIDSEFFATLRLSVVEGRPLRPTDATGDPVVVVNETFVRTYWPDVASGVGQLISEGGPDEPTYRVVGVAADTRYRLDRDPPPTIYLAYDQEPWRSMSLVLRTAGDPVALAPALRALVRELDSDLPVSRLSTVSELAWESLTEQRFYAVLVGSFGMLAVLLALVGVYGTTAHATRTRTREIGVRIALGAGVDRVVSAVVGRALALTAVGVALGLAGGLATTKLMSAFLFGIAPQDPATFGAVAVIVCLASVVASWVPGRRAAGVDPGLTLRAEG